MVGLIIQPLIKYLRRYKVITRLLINLTKGSNKRGCKSTLAACKYIPRVALEDCVSHTNRKRLGTCREANNENTLASYGSLTVQSKWNTYRTELKWNYTELYRRQPVIFFFISGKVFILEPSSTARFLNADSYFSASEEKCGLSCKRIYIIFILSFTKVYYRKSP